MYDFIQDAFDDITANIAFKNQSNVFTQPQQVPNATLPQHVTNKLQVETMFEMFKRELRGYNLASPDLTGKEYLGDGWYRLYDLDGITLDYNVNNGNYIINGTSQITTAIVITGVQNDVYFASVRYVSGEFTSIDIDNVSLYTLPFNTNNLITFKYTNQNKLFSVPFTALRFQTREGQVFDNYTFQIQLERGTEATPYTVPGKIPQYKIVGEA